MNDIDLKPLVRHHGVAPMWFTAARGTANEDPSPALQCPVCGSDQVQIRLGPGDAVVVILPDRILEVLPAKNVARVVDANPKKPNQPGVAVPMGCERGHRWLLDFDQDEDGTTRALVAMHDECYDELYPEVKESSPW